MADGDANTKGLDQRLSVCMCNDRGALWGLGALSNWDLGVSSQTIEVSY